MVVAFLVSSMNLLMGFFKRASCQRIIKRERPIKTKSGKQPIKVRKLPH